MAQEEAAFRIWVNTGAVDSTHANQDETDLRLWMNVGTYTSVIYLNLPSRGWGLETQQETAIRPPIPAAELRYYVNVTA